MGLWDSMSLLFVAVSDLQKDSIPSRSLFYIRRLQRGE